MINASAEFKEKLRDGAEVQIYADITLSDGTVLHLTPDDIWLGGCTIDDKTTDGKFGVSSAIGKTLSLRISNHDDQYSVYDFYNSIITLYVAMQLDDGTIEKIRKGIYYTTVPETPGDIIEISAVDGMYRLDRDYTESTTAYPATLQTIISDACLDCGIQIGFTQFDNMSFMVQEKPEKATYREIMSYACQIAGYNARIDNNGYMQLVWYNTNLMDRKLYDGGDFKQYTHDKVLDGGNFTNYATGKIISGGTFTDVEAKHIFQFKNLSVGTDDVVITGLRVVNDETEGFFGETGYVITVENNPFTVGKEQEVANYLGARMVGLSFRPFSGDVLGNPLYEPFDVCRISDRKGRTYRSVINSVSYTVGSYTQIACEAEDPVRNGSVYSSPEASAVVEARRNAEKQITEYDKAVQNMNQIAANTLGYHITYEDLTDGSRITYMHDKPLLKDSQTVYKIGIDGFFVSRDGGQNYTDGFDSNGNAVINILYAIGIVCDWIRGGTLTLGGMNNVNGILKILDADGKLIGTWGKDGILTTKGSFSGHVTAYSLTLGADANISAQKVTGLAGVATSGNYNDLSNKPTIPTVPDNIITEDEVSVSTSTDANGVVTKTITIGDETYTAKYSDNYVITNVGIGSQNTDRTSSYFKISREGLLEANNALIYGTIYASNGKFSGDVTAKSLVLDGNLTTKNTTIDSTGLITTTDNIWKDKVTLGLGGMTVYNSSGKKRIWIGSALDSPGIQAYNLLEQAEFSLSPSSQISVGTMNFEGTVTLDGPVTIKSLIVEGTKSRSSKTKNCGEILQYCYEMPSPMFGDIGHGKTDPNGLCYIYFDQTFRETITSEMSYYVFLQKEGTGDLWIEEKTSEYFLVKGTPELLFSWEVKARQKGYEHNRMDQRDRSMEPEELDYGIQGSLYVSDYEKEILNYENTD